MGDRVSGIPQDEFVAAWNAATSMVDVVRRMKEIAGGAVPRWAVMVRAVALRKGGIELRQLPAMDGGGVRGNHAARVEGRCPIGEEDESPIREAAENAAGARWAVPGRGVRQDRNKREHDPARKNAATGLTGPS